MGGKQRGRLLHGVSCPQGPTSLPPGWGLSSRGAGASGSPHPTATELLTRALPFPSLLGLLLRHHCVELLQSGGKRLTLSHTADLGQALQERTEALSPCQEFTRQEPVPARTPCHGAAVGQRRGCAALCPSGSICFTPETAPWLARPASSGTGQDVAAPQPCTHTHTHVCAHTCTAAPAHGLPSHSEADCGGLRVIHETPEIRSHGKGCGFPGGSSAGTAAGR